MSLSVVILSRNADNLEVCVAAVRRHEPDLRIIVVDDGLDRVPDGVTVVPGEKPFCYARNANIGIRAAARDDVVLLNDDALLESPGGFTVMQSAAASDPALGIIGGTCNNVGNPNQFRGGVGLRPESRMVCFVCVLIPRRTIERVGLLDERFVGYGMDDDDYSLRVRHAGLRIAVHDDCFVDHAQLESSYRGAAGAGGDFRPNLELFKQKWGHDNWGRPA